MELKELGLQRVSFNEKQRLDNIIAKEGDIGTRGLLVEFEKGLRCMCYMEIDGAIHEIEGVEVEEGLYEVIYPSSLLKGIVPAEIKFYKGKEILSNTIFDVRIVRNLFNLKNGIVIPIEKEFNEDITTTNGGDFETEKVRMRVYKGLRWRDLL